MQVLEKNVVAQHQPGRAPLCAGISYIHPQQPVVLRRLGWEVSDDVHDEFSDSISEDNGQTWSEPWPSLRSTPVPGGFIVHSDSAFLYLAERDQLLHLTNDKLEPDLVSGTDGYLSGARVRITCGAPLDVSRGQHAPPVISDFGLKQGLYVSFVCPLHDSRGRILVPVMMQRVDEDGTLRQRGFRATRDFPDVMRDVWDSALVIGQPRDGNTWEWQLGGPVPFDVERSSYLGEGTLAELGDGRLAQVLRGTNVMWPERPGYKWLSFSADGGVTWSPAEPLHCDDGTLLESSATGSVLFRSIRNGRLYWIGNLCTEGERPNGNMPRSPLTICEVQEEPFALKRGTLTVIDRRAPHEDARVQHSNFKFYQDRASGDVVLLLTRYGERGSDGLDWMKADLYQYRVAID